MVEYKEHVDASITLADNTYAEAEIAFPQVKGPFAQSNRNSVPMVIIHNIIFDWHFDSLMSTAFDDAQAHVCESSQSAIQTFENLGVVEVSHFESIGVPVNTKNMVDRVKEYPPVMYPYDNIFVGAHAQGTGYLKVRIEYTVRMVNRNEVLRSIVPRR